MYCNGVHDGPVSVQSAEWSIYLERDVPCCELAFGVSTGTSPFMCHPFIRTNLPPEPQKRAELRYLPDVAPEVIRPCSIENIFVHAGPTERPRLHGARIRVRSFSESDRQSVGIVLASQDSKRMWIRNSVNGWKPMLSQSLE